MKADHDEVSVIAGEPSTVTFSLPPRHPWVYALAWWIIGAGARLQRWAAGPPVPEPPAAPYYYSVQRVPSERHVTPTTVEEKPRVVP